MTDLEEREGRWRPSREPAAPLPSLASIADVEAITGASIDPADQPRVERLLAMASAAIRGWTHQTLSFVRDHEVTVPSSGTELLMLAELPVQDVTSIETLFGLDWWWADESELIHSTDPSGWNDWGRFSWDAAGRLRRLDGRRWGLPNDPVTVTYSHGWKEIPADIIAVCAAKVGNAVASAEVNPEGLRSVTIGDYTRAFADPSASTGVLNDGEKAILARYRAGAHAAALGTQ